jgi:hypothetical protein
LTQTEVLAALARAWSVAMIAVILLGGALALAAIWNGAIFCEALHEALSTNPELPQPADEVPINRHDELCGRGRNEIRLDEAEPITANLALDRIQLGRTCVRWTAFGLGEHP